MTTSTLLLPTGAVSSVIATVQQHGQAGQETGALLLTAPRDPAVRLVALAGATGIERGPGLFVITAGALDVLFTYAEERSLQVRAMIHSHPGEAFLSRTDRLYTLRMTGFINAVIPNFAAPPSAPAAWGWWRFEKDWTACPAPLTDSGLPQARILTFDSEGIVEH